MPWHTDDSQGSLLLVSSRQPDLTGVYLYLSAEPSDICRRSKASNGSSRSLCCHPDAGILAPVAGPAVAVAWRLQLLTRTHAHVLAWHIVLLTRAIDHPEYVYATTR